MSVASIVILTYNNLEYTRLCLESIYAQTEQHTFEVVLVDNTSQDGTVEFLQKFVEEHSDIRLILNSTNEGFARGNNRGAAAATGDYLVFLNNDTVVTSGWLPGLVRRLEDESVGMVGPATNASGNETCVQADYQELKDLEAFAQRYSQAHAGQAFEIGMLPFLCVALRRKVFEEIGPLDERFGVGMFEDDDYALRLKQRGYKLLCVEDTFIHHWGSAAFGRLPQATYRHLFVENLRKFEEKWGITWQPPLFRPELLRVRMRQMIDDAAWMAFQLESRDETIASLKSQLDEIHRSRAWSMVQGLWKIRIWMAPGGSLRSRLIGGLARRVWSWISAFAKGLGWLKRKMDRPMISWPAYSFYRYRQARQEVYATNLKAVRCPGQSGMVSIILPVYNGADYVAEAIESVLHQTYANYELVVVDDGSTDATPEIVETYARSDPRIRVIHQPNLRLPAALNTGHQAARGEYITWISADNHLKTEFLEKMVACLGRHPDWDMTYANIDLIGADGAPMRGSDWYVGYQNPPGSEHIALPSDRFELNVVANNYLGAAFLYRNRVNFSLGDYSRQRFGMEDYDYWMRVNALLTLRHADLTESLYEYRFHSTSLTSRDEELGITRRREGLMVFEDARRDFYLTPLAWCVREGKRERAQELAGEVRSWIGAANHKLLEHPLLDAEETHSLWLPQVGLQITDDPAEISAPPEWPRHVYKVLALCSDEVPPCR